MKIIQPMYDLNSSLSYQSSCSNRSSSRLLRRAAILGTTLCLTLSAVQGEQNAKAGSDPWSGLKVHNAPVINYDGQSYYPIFVERKPGKIRWEFVRDNDSPNNPSRLITLSVSKNTNISSLERALLHTDTSLASSRQVHQRNATHLHQSWWSGSDAKKSFHIVDWQSNGTAVCICEVMSRENVGPITQDWRQNFEKVLQQARPFLQESEKL